jgi:hypothetical protein
MSTGSDEPTHGQEAPPLDDDSSPTTDPHAAVDYPTDSVAPPPPYAAPSDYQQPAYPQTDYQQPAYPQTDYQAYPPPGYQQPPYPPPGYPQMGYPPAGYPPPYSGGYGYDPYAQNRPAGTNGKAIAALVTSLAGLFFCGVPSIVGFILGIIAMRETKATGQDGHGMALAGVIVGALAVVGWVLYAIIIFFAIAVTSTSPYGY